MDAQTWVAGLQGLGTGLGLIVAIGAQNVHVLRHGIRGDRVFAVLAVCILSDVVLITAGVYGLGRAVLAAPSLLLVARWAGAAVLTGYAVLALRRAIRGEHVDVTPGTTSRSLGALVATTMALTWLNPHVYLDTVLLLGSVAASKGPDLRWAFGIGACLGSVIWFTALGHGARLIRPLFARPAAWRVLDTLIAVIMVAMAISLMRAG